MIRQLKEWNEGRIKISFGLRVAWLLPDWLVYWAGIRMAAYASTEVWPKKTIEEIGIMDMLSAWEDRDGSRA